MSTSPPVIGSCGNSQLNNDTRNWHNYGSKITV